MSQTETEACAVHMYAETREFWDARHLEILDGACGYGILGTPPKYAADLLILGENPGFGSRDLAPHLPELWPPNGKVLHDEWALGRAMNEIFSSEQLRSVANNSMMANFLFFASSSIKSSAASRYPWENVAPPLRNEIDKFCAQQLEKFVQVAKPKQIFVCGIGAFVRHAKNIQIQRRDQQNTGRRRLIVTGTIFDLPAIGIMHLTGCRISSRDRLDITAYLQKQYC